MYHHMWCDRRKIEINFSAVATQEVPGSFVVNETSFLFFSHLTPYYQARFSQTYVLVRVSRLSLIIRISRLQMVCFCVYVQYMQAHSTFDSFLNDKRRASCQKIFLCPLKIVLNVHHAQ